MTFKLLAFMSSKCRNTFKRLFNCIILFKRGMWTHCLFYKATTLFCFCLLGSDHLMVSNYCRCPWTSGTQVGRQSEGKAGNPPSPRIRPLVSSTTCQNTAQTLLHHASLLNCCGRPYHYKYCRQWLI